MDKNRRKFLKTTGALAAGSIILPQLACTPKKSLVEGSKVAMTNSLDKFGIQLYTLRDDFPNDPKGVLAKLASYGYTHIEGYEMDQGLFWGMTPKDYQSYLSDLGMKIVASHCNINENFEMKVAQAASIGMDYLVCPWVGPQKSMDDWKKVTDKFNECGEICRKAGIKFAYHNHAYTFRAFTGMIPHDFIMDNTDPDLVLHEMDIYWVVTGQADPVEYLKKYSGRFRLCHIKDRLKDAPADERSASCNLGTGIIDYSKILTVARDHGMEYFIMEQERYDTNTPLESAKIGADYLKNLVLV